MACLGHHRVTSIAQCRGYHPGGAGDSLLINECTNEGKKQEKGTPRHSELIWKLGRPYCLLSLVSGSAHRLAVLPIALFTPRLLLTGRVHLLGLSLEVSFSREPFLAFPALTVTLGCNSLVVGLCLLLDWALQRDKALGMFICNSFGTSTELDAKEEKAIVYCLLLYALSHQFLVTTFSW